MFDEAADFQLRFSLNKFSAVLVPVCTQVYANQLVWQLRSCRPGCTTKAHQAAHVQSTYEGPVFMQWHAIWMGLWVAATVRLTVVGAKTPEPWLTSTQGPQS
jgi:hypothetical protein